MKKIALYGTLVALTILGIVVFGYYILAKNPDDFHNLPLWLMVLAMAYILLQLGKRRLEEKMLWYGHLYYIGLFAIILPIFNLEKTVLLTRIGTLFLIIPPVLEFLKIYKEYIKSKPISEETELAEFDNNSVSEEE